MLGYGVFSPHFQELRAVDDEVDQRNHVTVAFDHGLDQGLV